MKNCWSLECDFSDFWGLGCIRRKVMIKMSEIMFALSANRIYKSPYNLPFYWFGIGIISLILAQC